MIINPSTLTNAIAVVPDDDVNIPGPTLRFSGTANGNTLNKLIDTTRPIQVNPSIGGFTQTLETPASLAQVAFGGQGVQVGDVVYNTTDNTLGIVGAIDDVSTLSIVNSDGTGADLDLFPLGTEAYAIYQPNGMPFNNGLNFGFRALAGAILDETTDTTAAYTAAVDQPITASGGTIFSDGMAQTGGTPITFTLTVGGGGDVTVCTVALTGKFSASSLVGRTVIFDQASIRAVAAFGNTGTGGATFTFAATDENFTDRIQAGGQPKAFQIYNGGAIASFNVLTAGGDTVLIPVVQAGQILPLAVVRIWSAGTTATLGTTIAFT